MGKVNISRLNNYRSPEVMIHSADPKLTLNHIGFWIDIFRESKINFSILARDEANYKKLIKLYPREQILLATTPVDVETVVLAQENLKSVFYPSNMAKNIHLLRFNHIKHIFIGTKNSDQLSTIGKSYRAYDEIWVSSQSQVDKFKEAIDTRHLKFNIVGKPQLKTILEQTLDKKRINHLLYIPANAKSVDINLINYLIEKNYKVFVYIEKISQKEKNDIQEVTTSNTLEMEMYSTKEIFDRLAIGGDAIIVDDIDKLHIWWIAYNIPIFISKEREDELLSIKNKFPLECLYSYSNSQELTDKLAKTKDNKKCLEYYLGHQETLEDRFIKSL